LTNPAEYFHDDNAFLNEFLTEKENLENLKTKAGQINMNNYLLEKQGATALEQLAELMDKLERKEKDFWVLYCYKPPSINQKHFTPYRTGIIGIFKTLDDLKKRVEQIERENIAEYRDYQLFYASSKIIESEKDYNYPLGFNEAF
jgi:hypothetical protein